MLAHTTTPRPASPSHAAAMTELINLAGEGLPLHFWSLIAKPGEDPWQIGKDRAMRDSGSFSWRNAHVVEASGQVASLLVTYAIGDKPEPIDRSAMPSIFVPLQELENLALNTQYVNVLATRPDFRCRGFGSILLGRARELAGKRRLSIIVSDANKAAMSLYSKHGYTPVDSRPITTVPEWRNDGKNWVLMLSQA